ncbi:hypothetical protein G4D82_08050 [Flavobacterium sp. CYK-4]|uniref:YDG domain-containing protein n=1 Tax=Flavobacterium lotistagni TaxID=2709660 RepID=UPI0014087437|nr:YDG domain-containing protein [Flavobacterium lotistagni]NHM07171.1 hypothetical protein [Flavobacterium lotistagni]
MKNMLLSKKVNTFMFWCFAFLLLCLPIQGFAQLLTENFSYSTPGNLQTAASPNWVSHSGSSNYVQYTNTGLTFAGHADSGVGGAATTSSSGVGDHNRSFTSQNSGTVYMSCLVNITAVGTSGDYFLHYYTAPSTFNVRIHANTNSGNLRFGVGKSANGTAATTNFTLGTTYMLVAKYTFIAGATNDQVDLWILPTFAATESAAGAPLQTVTSGADAASLSAVAIRQGNSPTATIDAIRVGTSWADVAPSASLINGGTTSSTAFSTTYGTASASQSFAVSGSLLSNPLVATAQTGFEVSRNDVVSYGATASYTAAEANAGGVAFLVRLKDNASAGNYNSQNAVVLSSSPAPSANIVTSSSGNTVSQLGLTITGLSAQDKDFDGNTTATLTGTAVLNGVLFSDDVVLGGTPVANFSSAAVGTWPVTVTGYTITGTKAANYSLSQPTVANATINPSSLDDQVITFPALGSVVYGTASVDLLATSDNPGGNPITYTSSNTAVATISGNTAVIVGAGTTTITASQAGDATHNPAIDQLQTLTVTPLGITITGISALDKPYDGNTTATLTGTAVLSPAPIGSDVVTIAGTPVAQFATANAGTQAVTVTGYTITGAQAGNYALTQPTVADATITQLSQTITFFGTLPELTTLTAPITLNGTASSGLAVTFESSNPSVASISGNTLTILGTGLVTITAKQAGNTNYAAAPDLTQTRTVEAALYLNQFTGTSACPTQGNVPVVEPNVIGAIATRGTMTCSNLNNSFSSTGLNVTSSINNNSYVEFGATAASGYRLNLTKVSFLRSGSGTAPNQLEVRYSTDGFATSTSMNNTALTTTTATQLSWDFADFNTPISGTVTFRIYPYGTQRSDLAGGAAASSGTFRVDDLTIYGAVVLPPPTVVTVTPATDITIESATLTGDVTSTGGSDVLGNGIFYSITDFTPTLGEPGVIQLQNPSPSIGTGTFSLGTGNVLFSDTEYFYTAYANSAQGYGYGAPQSFYTLANVPVQPNAATNITTTSFDFDFDISNNPNTTQYAIQINSQYLQANGTLGATAVWQSAFDWLLLPSPHLISVTGLNPNTSYTYSVKARNGANVETAFGPSASVSTLPVTTPTLTADPLSGFGSICINTTSSANTFGLLGELLESDITVGPLDGYTFFNSGTNTYDASITLSPDVNGDLLEIISVKFTPTLAQSYDGNIPVSGGGAPTIFVSVTGSGINTPATVVTGTPTAITVIGATIDGLTEAGCSAITDSGIQYSLFSDFAGAVQVSGFPVTLTTLTPNTLYYVRAYATDSSALGISYGDVETFTTLGLTTGPVATAGTSVSSGSFVANWEAVTGAESYLLDVSTDPNFIGAITTIADWNFPLTNDNATIDGGITANDGKTLTAVGGVGTLSFNSVQSSTTSAASGASWNSGNGTKYWQIDISTVGYSSIKLSSAQRSSNTGPKDFKVQYSINAGGSWADVSGAIVTVGNNWTSGVLSDIALPATCDNQASVMLRWIMTSNNAVSGTVAAGGTSAIDSIVVTGNPPSFSIYENLSVNGLSQAVSGLAELTDYYYRVRAYSPNSTSDYSNVIQVTTTAAPPTFDSVSYSGATVCEGANGTFDVNGLTPNLASRIYYNINEGPTQSVLTSVADASGAATFEIPLPLSANFQLLTITAVERADGSSSIVVDSNNVVFITGIAENITYYQDNDTDGFGNPAVSQLSCTGQPSGYVTDDTDCDDEDVNKHETFAFYTDGDNDGYGTGATTTSLCAVDANTPPTAGYSVNNTDCDDTNSAIYQFATFYVDADGDTYGSTATASVCSGVNTPAGYSTNDLDCDDTNPALNPTNPCSAGSVVNLTLFIEGYYIGGSTMNSVKLNQDYVSPADEVEDLTIELHDATSYALVDTAIGTLKTDGTLTCTFNTAAAGSYYIVVKGSNIIETWSATAQAVGTTPLSYDFSSGASQAYGDNMREIETGVFAMYTGDLNLDQVIDNADLDSIFPDIENSNFGVLATDLNGDGVVDNADLDNVFINIENSIFANYPF